MTPMQPATLPMTTTPTTPRHPARYTAALLPIFADALRGVSGIVLDPFAGTGHALERLARMVPAATFVGIEIQPQYVATGPALLRLGSALALDFTDGSVDAIVTSPTYGNRMADHHDARDTSKRNTYRHALGAELHPDNSGALQWGPEYRDFHKRAWAEAVRVLAPGGRMILNIKDHVRAGRRQPVAAWHAAELERQGLEPTGNRLVYTTGNGFGANGATRIPFEIVATFRKPGP